MSVGSDNIGVDSKFLHEFIDPFTKKPAVVAVESDKLQGTHCLRTGAQYLFHVIGIAVTFRTVYMERPFTGLPPESTATYIQSVKRGTGHQTDGLNLEVFHFKFYL